MLRRIAAAASFSLCTLAAFAVLIVTFPYAKPVTVLSALAAYIATAGAVATLANRYGRTPALWFAAAVICTPIIALAYLLALGQSNPRTLDIAEI